MTHIRHAALAAAAAAWEEITDFPVNESAVARVVREELRRQEREHLDALNEAANARVVFGPETECPV